jgi:hypothetical protein
MNMEIDSFIPIVSYISHRGAGWANYNCPTLYRSPACCCLLLPASPMWRSQLRGEQVRPSPRPLWSWLMLWWRLSNSGMMILAAAGMTRTIISGRWRLWGMSTDPSLGYILAYDTPALLDQRNKCINVNCLLYCACAPTRGHALCAKCCAKLRGCPPVTTWS